VIGAITLSPHRQRLDLRFSVWHENIRTRHVVRFLKQLRHELVVVLDRLPAHRAAARQLRRDGYHYIRFEWLPACAPDLSPTEALWSYTKYSDLANFLPDDRHELRRAVCRSLQVQRRRKRLLRACFQAAKLRL
jgi:transposase